jgi:hypothetical protein
VEKFDSVLGIFLSLSLFGSKQRLEGRKEGRKTWDAVE